MLVVAAVVLLPGRSWAVFYPLGPSKDEWGLKYSVEVKAADGDKLNVHFTLADERRLKPIESAASNPRSQAWESVIEVVLQEEEPQRTPRTRRDTVRRVVAQRLCCTTALSGV